MNRPDDESGARPAGPENPQPAPPQLPELMASAAADAERHALAAATAAVRAGERALAEARAELARNQPAGRGPRIRGWLVRGALVAALLGMATVALWPAVPPAAPAPPADPVVALPGRDDPVVAALAAADRGDYTEAMARLDAHLQANPELPAAMRACLLLAVEHYAVLAGDLQRAQDCQRRVAGLGGNRALPEDLLAIATAAAAAGDLETMRRYYEQLLDQQRQLPSAFRQRMAAAWLQLDDQGASARAAELEQLRQRLREQPEAGRGGK